MFSNIDEPVRRPTSPASEAALHSGARKSARVVSSGGRCLELRNIGALMCPGGNGLTRPGKGCVCNLEPAAARDARGLDPTGQSPADKAATLSPHPMLRA